LRWFEELPRIFPRRTDKNHDKIKGGTAGHGKRSFVVCVRAYVYQGGAAKRAATAGPNIKGQDVEIT
jgi:hypothetical protein